MSQCDVFISYKSEKYNDALWVRDQLEKNGLKCWIAPDSIPGGSSYAAEISDAINNCKAFVLILSQSAKNSKWVVKELDQAINHHKAVFPFMIEDFTLKDEYELYLSNIHIFPAFNNRDVEAEIMIEKIKESIYGKKEIKKKTTDTKRIETPKLSRHLFVMFWIAVFLLLGLSLLINRYQYKKNLVAWEVGDATVETYVNHEGEKYIKILCPVTNTGGKNLDIGSCDFEIEDGDGNYVDFLTNNSKGPAVIQSGETGWYMYTGEAEQYDFTSDTNIKVTPTARVSESNTNIMHLETIETKVVDSPRGYIKLIGRIENTMKDSTESLSNCVDVNGLLFNSDDECISVINLSLYRNILPGEKIGFSNFADLPVDAKDVDHYEVYAYVTWEESEK